MMRCLEVSAPPDRIGRRALVRGRAPSWGLVLALLGLLFALGACGQPARVADGAADVDTSFIREYAETWGYTAGQPTGVEVTPSGDAILFLRSGPRDVVRNLYEIGANGAEVRGLARAADLLTGGEEHLTDEEKARRERMREVGRGFTWFKLSEDGGRVLTALGGRLYVIDRADGRVTPLRENPAGPAMDAKFSPDGRFVSCIRGHDVYVIDLATREEWPVTVGGTEDVSHGVAEFVAQEEMHRHTGYWWSGDSQWIAFEECDQRGVETLFIADARNPESPPKGWRYPRAGRTNATVRLGIVSTARPSGDLSSMSTRWVDWDRERYPYMAAVHWGKDAPLTVYVQTRDQREAVLYLVDHLTGERSELLKETDAAWINIDPDMPRWLDGGREFLWTTERGGEWELELRGGGGELKRTYRPGESRMYGVVAVHGDAREVIVSGGTDPTESHLYRVALDRGEVARLTEGAGAHGGKFARDGGIWVHHASMINGEVRHVVRGRDSRALFEIPSVASDPPFVPNLELTRVSAGGRTYRAAIIRPRNFDPSKKYPVIDYVYGGPGHPVVTASARAYLRQQWFADQGFMVVSIDGRGTPRRGREWERATAWNLIDLPLTDQVEALTALGRMYREMDMSRVGIYGWSFGGYFAAMAACRRPDVFHAAVAGAPVIEWEDYDTHYTERYMGLPQENPEGYRACSVLSYAAQLRRPLLLIHGTTDDNVYFLHTLKMSEALFRAGRPCDLLVLAGFTHMVPEPEVSMRLYERIARYFVTHLVERTPAAVSEGRAG